MSEGRVSQVRANHSGEDVGDDEQFLGAQHLGDVVDRRQLVDRPQVVDGQGGCRDVLQPTALGVAEADRARGAVDESLHRLEQHVQRVGNRGPREDHLEHTGLGHVQLGGLGEDVARVVGLAEELREAPEHHRGTDRDDRRERDRIAV